jgi:hypothetical protein
MLRFMVSTIPPDATTPFFLHVIEFDCGQQVALARSVVRPTIHSTPGRKSPSGYAD